MLSVPLDYLEGTFYGCEVSHISRTSNEEAVHLANIGSQCLPVPPGVFWEEIMERTIKENKTLSTSKQGKHTIADSGASKEAAESTTEPEDVMMVEVTWMQPYLAYMINKTLPENVVEARMIVRRSKAFIMVQGKLYKKSITRVLQRCVAPQEGKVILKEFKNYCESMGIKLKFASVALPKMNEQVEKANGLICNGIRRGYWRPSRKLSMLG
jgi:hypothetical protein